MLSLAVLALMAIGRARPMSAQLIAEFHVPSANHALEITPGPGGMWFTEPGSVGLITPGGQFSEFPVQDSPRSIVAGPDGSLWFTSQGYISRMTTEGDVTRFISNPLPQGGPNGPLGPFSLSGWPASISVGKDGQLWFTDADVEGGRIGHMTVDGAFVSRKYILSLDALDPGTITLGPDGNEWFVTLGGYADAVIGRADHPGFFKLSGVHGVGGLVTGADGNLWFTETSANRVGRMTTAGEITEFAVSGGPRGIAAGPDGNLWFTETEANRIGRISTAGTVEEFAIPTPDARPWGIAAGADGNIWFTENGASQIGKVILVEANGLALTGGRYQATATWQSSTASGEAHPVALTADTGYFWFSDPANVELVVKLLDGCAINASRWVFAAGLTDLNVVLTVTDSQTQQSRIYTNPRGTAYLPIQDTAAFPCSGQGSE
jgi:streptogramin lyase